ncbi:MAG: heme-binding domain-containing protein [Anaerolineae bacterium]|nr:heme-binding domain-containing protein [Anaerolineae bacterium]
MRKSLSSCLLSVLGFVAGGLVLLGLLIQLVPYGRNHTNPPVLAEPAWDSPQTRATVFRACADCHSNETVWPWYSHVAPVSWLVQRDVEEGRRAFNVSEWGRGENKGDDAAETVQKGTMPPAMYLLTHPAARLSPAEKQAFIQGLLATFGGEGGEGGGEGGVEGNGYEEEGD